MSGAFYIKKDRFIVLSRITSIRDLFEVLLIDNNKVKIRYSFINKYFIAEENGRIRLSDKYSLFKIIKKNNGSNVFISNDSNMALTVNENMEIVLSKYNDNNPNQEFVIQCINF